MTIYEAKYEATQPNPQVITVPTNSKFAVGVGLNYQGAPCKVLSGDVTLDGKQNDAIFSDMAVFNLSSDNNPGREVLDVDTSNVGVIYKDVDLSFEKPWTEVSATNFYDLSDFVGCTIHRCQLSSQAISAIAGEFPCTFICRSNNTSALNILQQTYIVDKETHTKPFARLGQGKTGGFGATYFQLMKVPNEEGTDWVDAEEFTIPEGTCLMWSGVLSQAFNQILNLKWTERFQGKYQLFLDKKDMNKAEGYNEFDASTVDSVNLSGTYSDDTEFSFDLLTK